MLDSDLQTTTASLEEELRKVMEKDEELTMLRGCLQKVTEEAAEEEGKEEWEREGEEGEEVEEVEEETEEEVQKKKAYRLKRIQAMLDTSKVSCAPTPPSPSIILVPLVLFGRFKWSFVQLKNSETIMVPSCRSNWRSWISLPVSPCNSNHDNNSHDNQ